MFVRFKKIDGGMKLEGVCRGREISETRSKRDYIHEQPKKYMTARLNLLSRNGVGDTSRRPTE